MKHKLRIVISLLLLSACTQPVEKTLDEMSCVEISELAKQGAQDQVLQDCFTYREVDCTDDSECGPFPCEDRRCLIQPCEKDEDCPLLCGLILSPVAGFCTNTDVIPTDGFI